MQNKAECCTVDTSFAVFYKSAFWLGVKQVFVPIPIYGVIRNSKIMQVFFAVQVFHFF